MAITELRGDWKTPPSCSSWELHAVRKPGKDTPSYKALEKMEKHGTPMPPKHVSPKKQNVS